MKLRVSWQTRLGAENIIRIPSTARWVLKLQEPTVSCWNPPFTDVSKSFTENLTGQRTSCYVFTGDIELCYSWLYLLISACLLEPWKLLSDSIFKLEALFKYKLLKYWRPSIPTCLYTYMSSHRNCHSLKKKKRKKPQNFLKK